MRKNPSSCDWTGIRTHVPTSEGFEVTNRTTGATDVMAIAYYIPGIAEYGSMDQYSDVYIRCVPANLPLLLFSFLY